MIYIVSGFMRTGTSMMMRALSNGGLIAAFDKKVDERMFKNLGSDVNPSGFFELSCDAYHHPDFPDQYEGQLLKIMWKGATELKKGKYKMIFMLRNPEEIKTSFDRYFIDWPKPDYIDIYSDKMKETIHKLNERKDIDLTVMGYKRVVEDPIGAFKLLKDKGWPIDIKKCSEVIDKSLYRTKIENLR